jgi:hypothetical protein
MRDGGVAITGLSVVKPIRKHPPRLRNFYPLKLEQSLLHLEPTLKSAQLTIGPDRSMAGNDDGKRVAR